MVLSRRGTRPVRPLAAAVALVVLAALAVVVLPAVTAAASVPAGFTEETAFSGLLNPTAVRFSPDGRVFVAEKRGTIQMYDSVADTTPTLVADLRTEVYNFWDRGLLGLALDPDFPTRPYLYALYTYDAAIGGTAPRWGTPDTNGDPCPTPPGATTSGCIASGRLVKLTLASGNTTTEQVLINDWCQQFPSHSVGDLVFGGDGALYVSAGDAASFTYADYGQTGNACGDPPGAVGTDLAPPSAEGGSLRSQDLQTPVDPVSLDGTVIRVDPDTGDAAAGNPDIGASDPNARRIVAYGMRNPFRMTMRPGTGELWIGDVGADTYEELDRVTDPTGAVTNFGWPCFEGPDRQPAFESAGLTLCQNLYAAGTDTKPFFSYRHGQPLSGSDTCATANGSSISGLSFQFYPGGPYPSRYDGALFFSDYSRNCVWVMTRGPDGIPDPSTVTPFVSGAAAPVNLQLSPQGELYYADFTGGTIRRIAYTGATPATCPTGQYLAQYFPNGTLAGTPASTGCETAPLNHRWGSGGPAGVGTDHFSARWTGSFDFPAGTYTFTATVDDGIRVLVDGAPVIDQWRNQSATVSAARALTAGQHQVTVEYYEYNGPALVTLGWAAQGAAPVPRIDSPPVGTTWQVGDPITFSGSATDPQDGALPAGALSWSMLLEHCPSACHTHQLQTWTGVSGGSIAAPDHDYPSYLVLSLTATDSAGRATTVTRRFDPRTVQITVHSAPSGLQATLGQVTAVTPFTRTLIVGSSTALSAPSPQTLAGASYQFGRWSDGGAASHAVTVGSAAATYTATYTLKSCPAGQYRADYFPNRTLTGAPAASLCEAAPLNRNWGTGAAPGVGADNFSARWSGTFSFPGGARTFSSSSDDGMRVWLDGTLIIDHWKAGGTASATRTVPAGNHTVKVEYFEATGPARAKLTW